MESDFSLKTVFDKIKKLGVDDEYIKTYSLPSWWDDELNNKPLAVLEGAGYISKRLNLDLESLLDETDAAKFKPPYKDPNTAVLHRLIELLQKYTTCYSKGFGFKFVDLYRIYDFYVQTGYLRDGAYELSEELDNEIGLAVVSFDNYPVLNTFDWDFYTDLPIIILNKDNLGLSAEEIHLINKRLGDKLNWDDMKDEDYDYLQHFLGW